MIPEIALADIPRRMRELNHGDDYFQKHRHFVIAASGELILKADNEYFYLVNDVDGISIVSEAGAYDLSDAGIKEQQHEHQGKTTLTNKTKNIIHVKFIQVIVKQH